MAFFRGSAILLLIGMGGARLVVALAFPNNGGGRTSRGFLSSHQRPSFAGAATIPSFLHSPDHPPTTLAAAAQRLEPHSESSSPKSNNNNNNNNTTKNDDLSKWARRTARKRQQVGALLDEILETLVQTNWDGNDNDKDNKQPFLPGELPWWNEIPVLMSDTPHGMDPGVDWIRSSMPNPDNNNSHHKTHHSSTESNHHHSKDDTSHTRRHQRALRKQYAVEAFVQVVNQILAPTDPSWQPSNGQDQPFKSILPNINHNHHNNTTRIVVDACSGAGNLALPLIQHCCVQHPDGETRAVASQVLAIDVNDRALQQLQHRYRYQPQEQQPDKDPPNSDPTLPELQTWCADLASVTLPDEAALVCSLHACGAASDLALWLATRHGLPFVLSPCCTAKALTVRPDPSSQQTTRTNPSNNHNDNHNTTKELDIAATQGKRRWMPPPPPPPLDQDMMMVWDTKASRQRSAASPELIHYPRSRWLRTTLEQVMNRTTDSGAENRGTTQTSARTVEDQYAILAKVADVGLGPQTPQEQRIHQQQAKWIIECDRLVHVVEEHDYHVQLWRMRGHEGYGKAELLVGIPSSPH